MLCVPLRRRAFAYAILSLWMLSPTPAGAVDFQEEADAAAKAGAIELSQLSTFRTFFDVAGATRLKFLKIANVKSHEGAITGDVAFFGAKSRILVFGGGGAKSSFVAFLPEKILGFADLFGDRAKLFDVFAAERQMIAFAVGDVKLKHADLPEDVRKIVGSLFAGEEFVLDLDQGVNILGVADLGKSKVMNDAIAFLGGKATTVAVRTSVAGNVLDSLLERKRPVPDLKMSALLPKFQPGIGGKIRLPAEAQFELAGRVSSKKEKGELSLKTAFAFQHARGGVPAEMELETKVSLEKGERPEFEVSAGLPEGKALEKAFGLKWLTISDYKMAFKGKPGDPFVSVELGGNTSFGDKTVRLVGGMQVGAVSAGMPVPTKLEFAVNDGADRVGQLSILDIVKAFQFIAKENGRPVKMNLRGFPDLAIAGTKVGEGPSIALNLKASDEAGFDIAGALRLFGTNVATVERAFLQPSSGLQLTAQTKSFAGIGPIDFPEVEIDAGFVVSAEDRTAQEPRVIVKTKSGQLFGSKGELAFIIRRGEFTVAAKQDFGSLLNFRFFASTGEQIKTMADLAKADFFIDGALSADPGAWIRTQGRKAVEDAFGALTSNADAKKAVDDLKRTVAVLDDKIRAQKAAVQAKRAEIRDAQAKVQQLQGAINAVAAQVAALERQVNAGCNQTKKVCLWYDIIRRQCTSHETVADVPARSACEWNRGVRATELLGKRTELASIVAAKAVAEKTLASVAQGVALLPVDLDPEVAYLIAQRDSTLLALVTAQQSLDEFAKASAFLSQGLNVVGSVGSGAFVLKNAAVQGSLRAAAAGKPVVLTVDYRLNGRDYRERLAYAMTDAAYNAAQLKVWVLGIALQAMSELVRTQPLVPHQFFEAAVAHFKQEQAKVRGHLDEALANLHEPPRKVRTAVSAGDAVAGNLKLLNAHMYAARDKALKAKQAELDGQRKARAAPVTVNSGDLLLYQLGVDGRFTTVPKRIGNGWGGFSKVTGGTSRRVFAIDRSGALHFYPQNSEGVFGAARKTGSGWGDMVQIVNGPEGVVYAVLKDGTLSLYRLNGNGDFVGAPLGIGPGWNACKSVFSNAKDSLYCLRHDGDLYHYPMAANGAVGGGRKIGNGWLGMRHVFSGGGGVIYAIDDRGDLYYYHHAPGLNWTKTYEKVGSGWQPYAKVFSSGRWVYAIRQ